MNRQRYPIFVDTKKPRLPRTLRRAAPVPAVAMVTQVNNLEAVELPQLVDLRNWPDYKLRHGFEVVSITWPVSEPRPVVEVKK